MNGMWSEVAVGLAMVLGAVVGYWTSATAETGAAIGLALGGGIGFTVISPDRRG